MTAHDPRLAVRVADAYYRSSLFAFVWKTFGTLHPGREADFVPGWHVEAMCHELDNIRAGENLRLVINIPPRHLKSITAAVAFVAFLLGHRPEAKIIVASYGLDLARKGPVKGTGGGETVTALPCPHDPALTFPVLQNLARDHPLGGDALRPLPALAQERRGPAARARHRGQPRDRPLLVAQVRPALCRRDSQETGRDFATWLGYVPRQHSIGGKQSLGATTKMANAPCGGC